MNRSRFILAVLAAALIGASPPATASPRHPDPTASCSVSGNVVDAVGLPTDEVINFLITDDAGTHGWVLGFTDDGTWSVTVPAPDGPTTYQFVSRTWGPDGSKYTVFAAC
jgi:hypothetical protein